MVNTEPDERGILLPSVEGILHVGFGHGPRVCPDEHLSQLEVSLVVRAFVKTFKEVCV